MRTKGSRMTHARGCLRVWPHILLYLKGKWAAILPSCGQGSKVSGDFQFLPSPGTRPVSAPFIRERFRAEGSLMPAPRDWCCIGAFQGQPGMRAIELPAGVGPELRSDMERLIRDARSSFRASLLTEEYRQKVAGLRAAHDLQEKALIRRMSLSILNGRPLERGPGGEPLAAGTCAQPDEGPVPRLTDLDWRLTGERMRTIRKRCTEEIEAFTARRAVEAIRPLTSHLRRKYHGLPEVLVYLDEAEECLLGNLPLFTLPEGRGSWETAFSPYEVRVIASGTAEHERPVLFLSPDACRDDLFGSCSPASSRGRGTITPGALHRSNGGFLVLEASWCLSHFPLWEGVKACTGKREIPIPVPHPHSGIFMPGSHTPRAIPYHATVVISGSMNELALMTLADPGLAHLARGFTGNGEDGDCGEKANGTPPVLLAGKLLHASARQEILSLCSLPLPRGSDLHDHLLKVVAVVKNAGGSPVTDLHIRKSLVALHPDLALMATDARPPRRKIRRPGEEAPRHGPAGSPFPIKLYPRKVITYGKQT